MSNPIVHLRHQNAPRPLCGVASGRISENEKVTCRKCLRIAASNGPNAKLKASRYLHREKAAVVAKGVSYRFTVKLSGQPAQHFAGHSLEELERDLAALAAPKTGGTT